MLKNPTPSSPNRNPVEHLYFNIFDPDSEAESFQTKGFSAFYAAAYWLNMIIDNRPFKWLTPNDIQIEHKETGKTLLIRGSYLEDLIEYKPTKEEKSWQPPYPDSVQLRHIRDFHLKTKKPEFKEQPEPTKPIPRPKNPSRYKTQKPPADDNQITVAQLAVQAGISPNKARQILRKNNIQKPGSSWTFDKSDKTVAEIQVLFGTK